MGYKYTHGDIASANLHKIRVNLRYLRQFVEFVDKKFDAVALKRITRIFGFSKKNVLLHFQKVRNDFKAQHIRNIVTELGVLLLLWPEGGSGLMWCVCK
jgi:hypothetical protein